MAPPSTDATRAFYGRWAGLYDLVARRTPGVPGVRERAAALLDLNPGDTVVEMGCGTGANVPYLRERVGPDGRVVGVDLTRGMLERGRGAAAHYGNVDLLQGDAARPPLDGPVDAVLATFVVGMLPDPAAAVETWLDHLAPGGRLVLLDAARSRRWYATPLNLGFRAFVRATTPGGGAGHDEVPAAVLDRRVGAARRALAERARETHLETRGLGFVYLAAGRR